MKKTAAALILSLLAATTFLAACGDGGDTEQSAKPVESGEPAENGGSESVKADSFDVSFVNGLSAELEGVYIAPTAADDWGVNALDARGTLDSGGTCDIKAQAYDFENYDILVTDAAQEQYVFERIKLRAGCTVEVCSGGVVWVSVTYPDGSTSDTEGRLNGSYLSDVTSATDITVPERAPEKTLPR